VERLEAASEGVLRWERIGELIAWLQGGLASIDRNFDVVRRFGGDPVAYASTVMRHSLYRRLWEA